MNSDKHFKATDNIRFVTPLNQSMKSCFSNYNIHAQYGDRIYGSTSLFESVVCNS